MAKKDITVSVEAEAYDVGVFMGNLIKVIRQGKPLAEIAALELSDLAKAVSGVDQLPAEIKEDRVAFVHAIEIPVLDALLGQA